MIFVIAAAITVATGINAPVSAAILSLATPAVDQELDLAKAMSARVTVLIVTEPHPVVGSLKTTLAFPTKEYKKVQNY